MTSNGEQLMDEATRDPPRLDLEQSDGESEEGMAEGVTAGLADSYEGLSLVREVESGGFKLPGWEEGRGGRNGADRSAGSLRGGAPGASPVAQDGSRETIRMQGFGLGGCGDLGVMVVGGEVRGGCGLWDLEGVGKGLWSMAGGGVNENWVSSDGEGVWSGRVIRRKLKEWGGVWDVGWNEGRRMDTSPSGEAKGANPFLSPAV